MAAPVQDDDDRAIRDAVVRLIDETPDKKEGRMFVALDDHPELKMCPESITQLFEDDQDFLIVHATCPLAAYLVLVDNIVARTSTSSRPVKYKDMFGEITCIKPDAPLYLTMCTLHEIGHDDEVHWFPVVSGRSTKGARATRTT